MTLFRMLPAVALLATTAVNAAPANDPWHAKARLLLEQSVNIPTVEGRGRVPELVLDIEYGLNADGGGGGWGIVPTDLRAHGRDERIPVKSLDDDVDHWEMMLKQLAG